MKIWLQNTSLSFKLLAGGVISILLIGISSFIIISYFFKISERYNTIHTLADNITIQMANARIAGKNLMLRDLYKERFYKTGESEYLKEHENHIARARGNISKLISRSSIGKKEEIEKLSRMIDTYNSIFLQIIAVYRERGFKDWGLLGDLRKAIHDVERSIFSIKSHGLQEELLQLRRLEKDYFLRGDEEYILKMEAQLKNLQNRIAQIGGDQQVAILKELKNYETAFKKYIDIKKKIGRTDKEGLQKEYVDVILAMKPLIGTILHDVNGAKLKARRIFVQVSMFTYFFGIGLISVILYLFARSLSLKLGKLKNAVLNVGKGHLDTKINITSRDEIGIVAAAFNKMTEDLDQLTVSKNYVDKIIESMTDTLIVINPWPTIKIVNRATLDLLGYKEHELIGMPVQLLFGQDSAVDPLFDELQKNESISNIEQIYRQKDGNEISVLFSGSIMTDNDGNIQGIVCVAQDNTERKRAEEVLKRSERELRLLSSKILSAQEGERKRLAQELHDGIGQSLTGIKFFVERSLKKMKDETEAVNKLELEPVVPMIQGTIEETRKIAMGLRPSSLDDLGITETIFWFCEQFQEIYSDIHVDLQIEVDDDQLPDDVKTAIFRIVQEALNNVTKHSKADLVRLNLLNKDKSVELVITDTGIGFAPEQGAMTETSDRGFGLASMKERAELSGGAFTIQTMKGSGTTIRTLWPNSAA